MAQLSFDGIQPVRFGGRDCTPSVDAELRLRIQSLKFGTDADEAHADETLAKAFPEDEEYIREFLGNQMTPFEKQQLQAYLLAGAAGIRMINNTITEAIKGATNGQ
mgnify:CR=1 FL=1